MFITVVWFFDLSESSPACLQSNQYSPSGFKEKKVVQIRGFGGYSLKNSNKAYLKKRDVFVSITISSQTLRFPMRTLADGLSSQATRIIKLLYPLLSIISKAFSEFSRL